MIAQELWQQCLFHFPYFTSACTIIIFPPIIYYLVRNKKHEKESKYFIKTNATNLIHFIGAFYNVHVHMCTFSVGGTYTWGRETGEIGLFG